MSDLIRTDEFSHKGHKFIARHYRDNDMGAPWDEHDGHGPVTGFRTLESKTPGQRPLGELGRDNRTRFYDWQAAIVKAKEEGWGLGPEALADLAARLAKPIIKRRAVSGVYHVENGIRQDKLTFETVTIPGRTKAPTKRQIRAEAVRLDYERLDGWARDQWEWVGVSVCAMRPARDRLESALEDIAGCTDLDSAQDTARAALYATDEFPEDDFANALWGIEGDSPAYLEEVARDLADQIIATL